MTLVMDGSRSDLPAACRALERHSPPRPTLSDALAQAKELVDDEWPRITEVAKALLDSPTGTLTYAEVLAVLAAQKARWTWAPPRQPAA
jgi:hypothetical protein